MAHPMTHPEFCNFVEKAQKVQNQCKKPRQSKINKHRTETIPETGPLLLPLTDRDLSYNQN